MARITMNIHGTERGIKAKPGSNGDTTWLDITLLGEKPMDDQTIGVFMPLNDAKLYAQAINLARDAKSWMGDLDHVLQKRIGQYVEAKRLTHTEGWALTQAILLDVDQAIRNHGG